MSLNETSSQAGKRQRFDQLQYKELSYAELLEDYTETARGISFAKTVGDKVKVSSYSLGTTSSALIPVLTVRLKDGCEDKGYSTYSLQDNLLFTLKEPEIPSNILSAIQELQPYVSAIGINNSIREFRCPEWLTIRSPKGVFFFFPLKNAFLLCLLKISILQVCCMTAQPVSHTMGKSQSLLIAMTMEDELPKLHQTWRSFLLANAT